MTNNELDKPWLNECRATMQHYEAPAPADGWADIVASVEAGAMAGAASQAKAASMVPLRTWLWRAAAILLLLLLVGGGAWLALNGVVTPLELTPEQLADMNEEVAASGKAGATEKALVEAKTQPTTEKVEPVAGGKAGATEKVVAEAKTQPTTTVKGEPVASEKAGATEKTIVEAKTQPATENVEPVASGKPETSEKVVAEVEPQSAEKGEDVALVESDAEQPKSNERESLYNAEEHAVLEAMEGQLALMDQVRVKSKSHWTIGAGMGVSGTGTSTGDGEMYSSDPPFIETSAVSLDVNPAPGTLFVNKKDPRTAYAGPDDFAKLPIPTQHLPQASEDPEIEADHHLVWSFGATVSCQFRPRMSVVTGLTYTRLTSDVKCYYNNYKQQVHYLGLPVALQYALYEGNRLSLYASGGAMLDRLLYAERGGCRLDMSGWQWSINSAVGAQLRLTKHCALYAEPNLSYWFDNGSDVPTYRTEHPVGVSFQLGIRVKY